MMKKSEKKGPLVAIACGGSGGHFYPGIAVAQKLYNAGCEILLIVTEKEIDQVASAQIREFRVERMPAVGLTSRNMLSFFLRFIKSYLKARKLFRNLQPKAVLGMGGFSSAPTVLAAPSGKCKAFIHEGNSIPGRANRLVAPFVHTGFVHFPQSVSRLRMRRVDVVGMPVRANFSPSNEEMSRGCKMMLGLDPDRPVLLAMGGSQGARALNSLVVASLKKILRRIPDLQIIHLTGQRDFESVQKSYQDSGVSAMVREYFAEMDLVMGAATVIVSRSGASSLAETARMRIPSILIPLPTAADNHQYYNALAFEETGAAILFEQPVSPLQEAAVDDFADVVSSLLTNEKKRSAICHALAEWGERDAATEIAKKIIEVALPQENLNMDWSTEPVV